MRAPLILLILLTLLASCQIKDQVVQSSMEGRYTCKFDLDKLLENAEWLDSLKSARQQVGEEISSSFSSDIEGQSEDFKKGLQQLSEGLLQMGDGLSQMALGLGKTLAANSNFQLELLGDGKATLSSDLPGWDTDLADLRWRVQGDSIFFHKVEGDKTSGDLGFHWTSKQAGTYQLTRERFSLQLEKEK